MPVLKPEYQFFLPHDLTQLAALEQRTAFEVETDFIWEQLIQIPHILKTELTELDKLQKVILTKRTEVKKKDPELLRLDLEYHQAENAFSFLILSILTYIDSLCTGFPEHISHIKNQLRLAITVSFLYNKKDHGGTGFIFLHATQHLLKILDKYHPRNPDQLDADPIINFSELYKILAPVLTAMNNQLETRKTKPDLTDEHLLVVISLFVEVLNKENLASTIDTTTEDFPNEIG